MKLSIWLMQMKTKLMLKLVSLTQFNSKYVCISLSSLLNKFFISLTSFALWNTNYYLKLWETHPKKISTLDAILSTFEIYSVKYQENDQFYKVFIANVAVRKSLVVNLIKIFHPSVSKFHCFFRKLSSSNNLIIGFIRIIHKSNVIKGKIQGEEYITLNLQHTYC